jgi:hypothetical protein
MEQRQIIRKGNWVISPFQYRGFPSRPCWLRDDLKAKVYPGATSLCGMAGYPGGWFEKKRDRTPGAPGCACKELNRQSEYSSEQVLWYEDMEQVLRRAEHISFTDVRLGPLAAVR